MLRDPTQEEIETMFEGPDQKVMICGDWHGDTMHGISCIIRAEKLGIREIFVCGDFGYWPRSASMKKFVPTLQRECEKAGVWINWIDGNHEDFDSIATWENTDNITYLPRGTSIERGNTKFATCGGAFSIDRQWRQLGVSYFNEELTTYRNALETIENGAGADVLLSHDAPTMSPVLDEFKQDSFTEGNRALIQGIVDVLQPKYNFHGHYHQAYAHQADETTIVGLARNEMPHSRGIFNCTTIKWEGYV